MNRSAIFSLGALSTISQHKAFQALLFDPKVTDIDSGRAILDDLLAANAMYLPQLD